MNQVKGTNMAHWQQWVTREYGKPGWRRLVEALDPEDAATIRSLIAMAWYPLRLQNRVLHTLIAVFPEEPDVLGELTKYEAHQDVTVIHRALFRFLSPATLLSQCMRFWRRFYDAGVWEYESSARAVKATLSGIDVTPLFAEYLCRYLLHVWDLAGTKNGKIQHRIREGVLHLQGTWEIR